MSRTSRDRATPAKGTRSWNVAAAKPLSSTSEFTDRDDTPALFDPVIESRAYGRKMTVVSSQHVLGPGPRPATTGPENAEAPDWWWAETERIVLALIDSGHGITADDLRERYPTEPPATGAAIGALFAKLARAGRIREAGMVRSRRPEAHKRRIIIWGAS